MIVSDSLTCPVLSSYFCSSLWKIWKILENCWTFLDFFGFFWKILENFGIVWKMLEKFGKFPIFFQN